MDTLEAPTVTRTAAKLAIVKKTRTIERIAERKGGSLPSLVDNELPQNRMAGFSLLDISEDTSTARALARKSIRLAFAAKNDGSIIESKATEKPFSTTSIPENQNNIIGRVFQRLKDLISIHRISLSGKELESFDYQWGLVSDNTPSTGAQNADNQSFDFQPKVSRKIFREVLSVREESKRRIFKLKLVGNEQAGLELLHLFLIDLLGRHSSAAKIFISKLGEDFKEMRVVGWRWKLTASIILLALNVFFFYDTMLYASIRGLAWQWLFLSACIAQIMVEVFINETMECLWLNYFIPLLAAREVTAAHKVLINLADNLCDHIASTTEESNAVLNAPEYLFVSTQTAKSFPHLMESSIIQLYRSSLPGASAKQWHKSMLLRALEAVISPSESGARSSTAVHYVMLLALSVLSLLEFFATVPYLLQRMFVRFCQPFVVSGIALLFSWIIQSPLLMSLLLTFFVCIPLIVFRRYFLGLVTNPKKSQIKPLLSNMINRNTVLHATESHFVDNDDSSISLSFEVSLPSSASVIDNFTEDSSVDISLHSRSASSVLSGSSVASEGSFHDAKDDESLLSSDSGSACCENVTNGSS